MRLKVNMERVYDRMHWDFMETVLIGLDFIRGLIHLAS